MLAVRATAIDCDEDEGLTWAIPSHSRSEVNTAGRQLIAEGAGQTLEQFVNSREIINNWRAAHSFPLNTATNTLRGKARAAYRSALVSQRLKRLSSIRAKLERFPTMKLSQMQDIGGCRATVATVSQVRRLLRFYADYPIFESIVNVDDYVSEPRASGYRGIHLIYRYEGLKPDWHGLKVEIQLRSRRMHAWATAVEIVGTFTQQALKASQGEAEWLRFFQLMSSVLAADEGTPRVGNTPRNLRHLKAELREYAERLEVARVLTAYRDSIQLVHKAQIPLKAHWYVLMLDTSGPSNTLIAYGFPRERLIQAQGKYETLEQEAKPGVDVVLTSVDHVKDLRRAYPNYFLDSEFFLELLAGAV